MQLLQKKLMKINFVEIVSFRKKEKPNNTKKKQLKEDILKKTNIIFLKVEKEFLMLSIAKRFQ